MEDAAHVQQKRSCGSRKRSVLQIEKVKVDFQSPSETGSLESCSLFYEIRLSQDDLALEQIEFGMVYYASAYVSRWILLRFEI